MAKGGQGFSFFKFLTPFMLGAHDFLIFLSVFDDY
jgi:hypothetical protein